MNTLLLDRTQWDLVLDASGNIALASEPYAIAQDGSSAIRTFQGEVYYDITLGVPYMAQILGKRPPLSLIKAQMVAAALTVPDAVFAKCYIASIVGRKVTGQVQITDTSGTTTAAGF